MKIRYNTEHTLSNERNRGNVINLHITDACNFRCVFCFAHFGAKKNLPVNSWKKIVDNIIVNCSVERFNLAGGEPLLYKNIKELITYIYSKGIAVSIITNGFNLSAHKINLFSDWGVSMIGLSIDSADISTLHMLGRKTNKEEILNPATCIDFCRRIKERGMVLKINTVVSRENCDEDLNGFIRAASPDRWKILKIKEFKNHQYDNSKLMISDSEFYCFVNRHKSVPHIVEEKMANSYIMVDALGNLVDTGSNNNTSVADLLTTNFNDAFSKLEFDYGLYQKRYAA